MKLQSILLVAIFVIVATSSPSKFYQQKEHFGSSLEPGRGYSVDTQQIAQAICYKMNISAKSNKQSTLKLNQGSSFSEISNTLGIDVQAKAGYGMFAIGASFNYMRSISDTDSSFSISYYHLIERQVSLKFNSSGVLNDVGKMVYQNGKNAVFRLACGDQIITSYKQRASLLFTFNLQFHTHSDSMEIKAGLGASYGDFFSMSAKIQDLAVKKSITGTMNLQVYQVGGKPSEVAKVINSKDQTGTYYILKCNIQNQTACSKTVSDLLDYATKKFPDQIDLDKDEGLDTSGTNTIKYTSASYFGITLAPTFVTSQVKSHRQQMASQLMQNQFYKTKLNIILNNYAGPWVTTSNIYHLFQNQYSEAIKNINSLFNPSNPEEGGQGCFSNPDRCDQIYEQVQKTVTQLQVDKLQQSLQTLRYKYSTPVAMHLYKNGDVANDWTFKALDPSLAIRGLSASISETNYKFTFTYFDGATKLDTVCYSDGAGLTSTNKGASYSGQLCLNTSRGHSCKAYSISPKLTSEYYFDKYKLTDIYEEGNLSQQEMIAATQ